MFRKLYFKLLKRAEGGTSTKIAYNSIKGREEQLSCTVFVGERKDKEAKEERSKMAGLKDLSLGYMRKIF